MKVDMHTHSVYSPDGEVPVKDMLKIARKKGLGGIAITDHNEIKGALEARKLGIILVIPGIEVSTSEGHVLAYGVDCLIPRGLGIEETIERIHDCGGIAVAAHPYRFWSGIGEKNTKAHGFDAVEVFNGRCKANSNKRAEKLVRELNRPFTAGSDAHRDAEIGKAGIITYGESVGDVIEDVLKKKVEIFGTSRTTIETLGYVKKAVTQWIGRGFRKI